MAARTFCPTARIGLIVLLAVSLCAEAGEAFDVAVLNPPVLDDLIRQGRIAGEGASGKYFVSLVERLGMTAEMKPRMRPMPAEYNVEMVARGEADLVVVVASRISGVPGVVLVGPIPQELQTWIGFTAGVAAAAKEPEAARAMIRFFTAAPVASVLRAMGVEPFVE
jgi:molybdate transport system substrate-binding protein